MLLDNSPGKTVFEWLKKYAETENIYCVNFWPGKNIDEYLNLQGRIEKRMAAMTIV